MSVMKGALCTALLLFGLSACRGRESDSPPIVPIRNMHDQPRYDAQDRGEFFEDQRAMRPVPTHTVSAEMEENLGVATGRVEGDASLSGEWVAEVPADVAAGFGGAANMLARGQERYNIYCSPCHGFTGAGNGMVATRATELGYAALAPPTFGREELYQAPDGHIFATISNGIRSMPAYKHNIAPRDRWAIVSYVRALQLRLASEPAEAAQ